MSQSSFSNVEVQNETDDTTELLLLFVTYQVKREN
jgi:hypothetical protein